MPKPSTSAILARLIRAFPRQPLPTESAEVYVDELADLPLDVLDDAVSELIRSNEFFPTIRAIRAVAADHLLGLPSPVGALAQIEARISWAKRESDPDRGDAPPVHPTVKQALDFVGGYGAFRTAEESTVIRGQFLRLYKELREDTLYDATIGRRALPPAA